MSTLTEAALAPQQRDHGESANNNNADENNDNEDQAKDSSHHHQLGTRSDNGHQEQSADDATDKSINNKQQTTNEIVIDRAEQSDSADADDDSNYEQGAYGNLAHQRATTATERSVTNDNSGDSNDSYSKHDSPQAPTDSSDLLTGISEGAGDSSGQQVEDDKEERHQATYKSNNNIHKQQSDTNNLNEISSVNYKTTMDTNSQGAIVAQMHACRLCDKLLSSSSSLDRHMLTHSGERPFVCKRCHMTFTTNGNMHRHMRTHLHKDTLARQQFGQQIKSSLTTGVISPESNSPAPDPTVMARSMRQQSPSLLSALSGCNIRDIIESTNKTSSNLAATSSSNQSVTSMPIIESLTGSSAMASNGANLIAPLISPIMANATQQQQSTVADSHAMTALLNQQLIAALSHQQPAAAQQLGQEIASRTTPSKFVETESIKSHHIRTLTTNASTAITTTCSLQQPLRVSTTTTAEQQSSPSSYLSSSLSSSPITSPHLSRKQQQQQQLHHSYSAAAQLSSTLLSANAQNRWPNQSQMADNNSSSNDGQQPFANTNQQQIFQSKDILNSYDPSAIVLSALQSATNGAQVDLESVKAMVLAAAAAAAAAAATAATNHQPSSRSAPIEASLGCSLKRASSREGDEDDVGDDEADGRCSNDKILWRTNTSVDNDSWYGRRLRNKRRKQVNPRSTKQQVAGGPIQSLDSELAGNVDDQEAGEDSSSSILSSDSIKAGHMQTRNARRHNLGTTTSSSENRSKKQNTDSIKKSDTEEDVNNNNQSDRTRTIETTLTEPSTSVSFTTKETHSSYQSQSILNANNSVGVTSDSNNLLLESPLTTQSMNNQQTTSVNESDDVIEDISQSYVKTANPNAARKGGKRNRHCYKCKLCTYSSVDRCTLVRHLRIHSGERPYICGICRYAFTTKANCERHVRKRHKKQYNSLGGAGGVKGGNGGGRSLIITDHNNHQTIPVKVNPVAAQTISQTLQKIKEKQQDNDFDDALEMVSSDKNLSQQLALNSQSSFTNLLRQTPFNPIDLAAQALDLSCKFKTTK